MSIISQPLGVLPVHTPLIYTLQVTIPFAPNETLKQVRVTVTNPVTGEVFTFRQNFDNVIISGTISGVSEINLSAIGKSFFCNDVKLSAFGVLGSQYSNINPESVRLLSVTFEYDKLNSAGILEDVGITDNATDITLLNSTRDLCEAQNINGFITASTDRRFLTNRPEAVPICFGEDDFLQYWTEGINSFKVDVYPNPTGPPRATDIFFDSPIIITDTVASVGAGVANINDVTGWNGGGITIQNTDFKYCITAGFYDGVLDTFTAVTREQCYIISECCERSKCTLFWLNRLGGVDSFTFSASKQIRDSPESAFYEKVRRTLFDKSDYGRQKYDSRDKNILEVSSFNLCEDVSQWLRELQTSTRVYKKVSDTECISVVVRDGETVISDDRIPVITRTLTLEYSIDPTIQNNV